MRSTSRFLRIVALVALLSLFVGACGGSKNDNSSSGDSSSKDEGNSGDSGNSATGVGEFGTLPADDAKPVDGGTMRVGLEAETDGLNPTTNRFAVAALQMGYAVFDPLTAYDKDGNVVPYLAESLTPNTDFTEWTIKLRPNVNFHDGTPLNADAIVTGIQTQVNDPLIGLAVKPSLAAENFAEKIDDLTVLVRTAAPNAHFPAALTGQLGMVASPAWLAAAKANPDLNQEPVGTGPFKFDKRTKDEVTRFVRNDAWWGNTSMGAPHLDAIEFYPIPDAARRADQTVAGDLDLMHTTNQETQEALRDSGLRHLEEELGEETFLLIRSDVAPFDDDRIREALILSTDANGYNELENNGKFTVATQMFHPDLPFYNPDVTQEYNPGRAAELVAEVCAERPADCTPDGKFKFKYKTAANPQNEQVYEILADMWKDNFAPELETTPQDQFISQVALGSYQVVLWRQFGAPDPDPDEVWISCKSIGALSLNWPRYCDENREKLLEQARATPDKDEQVKLWKEIVANMAAAHSYVFLNHTRWSVTMNDNVHGLCDAKSPEGTDLICFENGRFRVSQMWVDQ